MLESVKFGNACLHCVQQRLLLLSAFLQFYHTLTGDYIYKCLILSDTLYINIVNQRSPLLFFFLSLHRG